MTGPVVTWACAQGIGEVAIDPEEVIGVLVGGLNKGSH